MKRQPGGGSCECEQAPHQQPAWGFTSHRDWEELHTAPEQLLSCSVSKSKAMMKCQIQLHLYGVQWQVHTRGEGTTLNVQERGATRDFCTTWFENVCLDQSKSHWEKQQDHLVKLAEAELV